MLPAADGAAVIKAIERVAGKLPELPAEAMADPKLVELGLDLEPSTEDRFEARCADALVALASQAIASDADPDRATVVAHTTLGSCCDHSFTEIEGGPVLHPEAGKRIKCGARISWVLSDEEGNALGIGRTSRCVSPWLMRLLVFRDQCCTFPGCEMRAFVEAHHIIHWDDGGPTALDNLALVCRFHHKLLHEFDWEMALEGSTVRWFRPDGRLYEPAPDPPARPRLEPPAQPALDDFEAPAA
ncbi:MAG: HNH endonuclease [Actinomycetota bacterium]